MEANNSADNPEDRTIMCTVGTDDQRQFARHCMALGKAVSIIDTDDKVIAVFESRAAALEAVQLVDKIMRRRAMQFIGGMLGAAIDVSRN